LQKVTKEKFKTPEKYEYDHGGLGKFLLGHSGDEWYSKTLPYMDPATRNVALASLRKYFHDDVLVTNRFTLREFPKGSGHQYYISKAPASDHGNVGRRRQIQHQHAPNTLAYCHYSGDWDLIKERWRADPKTFLHTIRNALGRIWP